MRVPGVASSLSFCSLVFIFICSAVVVRAQSATTTVTISNTVETAGIDRPGINLGGLANYGSQQLLKSLNYASGGYMPGHVLWGDLLLQQRGNTARTTTWYNNITDASGFPRELLGRRHLCSHQCGDGGQLRIRDGHGVDVEQGSIGITFTLIPCPELRHAIPRRRTC